MVDSSLTCEARRASRPPQLNFKRSGFNVSRVHPDNKIPSKNSLGGGSGVGVQLGAKRDDILPIVHVSIALSQLRAKINEVAGKKEVVLWRHREGITHEGSRIDRQGSGHLPRDTVV